MADNDLRIDTLHQLGKNKTAVKRALGLANAGSEDLTYQPTDCVTNVGSANNSTAEEYGDAYSHVTVLTIPEFTQALAGSNLGFGKKMYDFPLGAIKCKRALIDITLTAASETAVGEVGLGTVIASGAVTGLGGTATFENIVDGFANTAISDTGAATQAAKECEADNPDGTSTALDLYLNFAGGWSKTENLTISGTITLFWDFLGTFS